MIAEARGGVIGFAFARHGKSRQTCRHILTISLLRRRRAVGLRVLPLRRAGGACRTPNWPCQTNALSARLGRFIPFRLIAERVESPLLASARGGLRVLRSGRAGPTSRGRAKLTFRCGSLYPNLRTVLWPCACGGQMAVLAQLFAPFSVRAPCLYQCMGTEDQPRIWAPVALVRADEILLIIRSISLSVKVLLGSSRTKFRA